MKVVYTQEYNFRLGPLRYLHRFDGQKFRRVYEGIREALGEDIVAPPRPLDDEQINAFVNRLMAMLIKGKRPVLQALEALYIPLLPFSFIDDRVLLPMRWGAAGTLQAARLALGGEDAWNLSGGYHHASQHAAEGFCIYNDIGIAYQQLLLSRELRGEDRILIIDVDAHHGNGNARAFVENKNVVLLDAYNVDVYPDDKHTRHRVDIAVPLRSGTDGATYLSKLEEALDRITSSFRLAFVVAGTDVLTGDPLGKLDLTIGECVERDRLVLGRLNELSTPAVVLAGGGYSADSTKAMIASILRNVAGRSRSDGGL